MTWQLQEAKQRFSEVVDRARIDGPQFVTRRGKEVVVIVDYDHYRQLTEHQPDFRDFLLRFPPVADDVFDEIAAERARQLPREVELAE